MALSRKLRSGSEGSDTISFRVTVMGSSGVGKSSIISQFLYEKFQDTYRETVEDMHTKLFEVGDKTISLNILDTAGHNEFPAMRKLAISTSDAFILVYSITEQKSFEEMKRIRDEITVLRGSVPTVIVCNKADIKPEAVVEKCTMDSIVSIDWEATYVEVSAKDNINVSLVFQELLQMTKLTSNNTPLGKRNSLPDIYRRRRLSSCSVS